MADGTAIEWTDATVNAVNGCSVVSPGCTHCYAMRLAGTRMRSHPSRAGLTQPSKAGPVWTGEVRLNEATLLAPLRWKRPRRIFWNAHGDLFHENVPDEWIDRCFAVMALTPQHQHQVLTKRAGRMQDYLWALESAWQERLADANPAGHMPGLSRADAHRHLGLARKFSSDPPTPIWPLPNVWLGVSVEDQARAEERIPHLLATSAAVRFLSCEPLLGPVWPWTIKISNAARLLGAAVDQYGGPGIDWVIVGGESGPKARPMHPDWARSLRDQCAAAGVPFFFKQWGEWAPGRDAHLGCTHWMSPLGRLVPLESAENVVGAGVVRAGKKLAGRTLDGVRHDGMPA